jgi:hypothetical protein
MADMIFAKSPNVKVKIVDMKIYLGRHHQITSPN